MRCRGIVVFYETYRELLAGAKQQLMGYELALKQLAELAVGAAGD